MSLTAQQIQAAALVAEGNLCLAKIAAKVECGERTLDDWQANVEFQQEKNRYLDTIRDRVTRRGIGSRERRLRNYDTLYRRSEGFLLKRAAMMVSTITREIEALETEATRCGDQAEEMRDLAGSEKYRQKPKARTALKMEAEEAEARGSALARKAAAYRDSLPMVRTGMARMELKSIHLGEKQYDVVPEFFYDEHLRAGLCDLQERAAIERGEWKNNVTISNPDGSPIQTGIRVLFVSADGKDRARVEQKEE